MVVEGRTLTMEKRCPHQAVGLHNVSVISGVLRCPRHAIEFDLSSGRALNAPCAVSAFLKVAYAADQVGIDL